MSVREASVGFGNGWGSCGLGVGVWVERVGVQQPDDMGAAGAQRMLEGVAVISGGVAFDGSVLSSLLVSDSSIDISHWEVSA